MLCQLLVTWVESFRDACHGPALTAIVDQGLLKTSVVIFSAIAMMNYYFLFQSPCWLLRLAPCNARPPSPPRRFCSLFCSGPFPFLCNISVLFFPLRLLETNPPSRHTGALCFALLTTSNTVPQWQVTAVCPPGWGAPGDRSCRGRRDRPPASASSCTEELCSGCCLMKAWLVSYRQCASPLRYWLYIAKQHDEKMQEMARIASLTGSLGRPCE